MKLKLKIIMPLICFIVSAFALSVSAAEPGQIYGFKVVNRSDTTVSVQYNIGSEDRSKQKRATITAYVDGEEAWKLTLGSSDSNHTSVAVLTNLKPDTEYTLTMQMTYNPQYCDLGDAPMSEPFVFSTLPDQSKMMNKNIAYGKPVEADSSITNAYSKELITNGFSGTTYNAYDNWSSANNANEHWAYIDLEKESYFDRIVIKFLGASNPSERTYPYSEGFDIQASNDAQNWVTLKSVTDNNQAIYEYTFDKTYCYRYVKIKLTKAYGTQVRFRLSEVEIYSAKGLESVLPQNIGYSMGVNQVIDEYIPRALLNSGEFADISECEYTVSTEDTDVITVEDKKITAVGKGEAVLNISLTYNGVVKNISEKITVLDLAFAEVSVKNSVGDDLTELVGGEDVYCSVKAYNYNDEDKNLFAVIAYYDNNGRMVAAKTTDFSSLLKNGGNFEQITDTITVPENVSGGILKVHLIDSITSLKAYSYPISYEEVQQ